MSRNYCRFILFFHRLNLKLLIFSQYFYLISIIIIAKCPSPVGCDITVTGVPSGMAGNYIYCGSHAEGANWDSYFNDFCFGSAGSGSKQYQLRHQENVGWTLTLNYANIIATCATSACMTACSPDAIPANSAWTFTDASVKLDGTKVKTSCCPSTPAKCSQASCDKCRSYRQVAINFIYFTYLMLFTNIFILYI